jgi:hypothetical protein
MENADEKISFKKTKVQSPFHVNNTFNKLPTKVSPRQSYKTWVGWQLLIIGLTTL